MIFGPFLFIYGILFFRFGVLVWLIEIHVINYAFTLPDLPSVVPSSELLASFIQVHINIPIGACMAAPNIPQ